MTDHRPLPSSAHRTLVWRPPDFDQFWQATLAATAPVPLAPELSLDPLRSTPEVEVFDVRYGSYQGLRIAAWYCRPRAATGRLPGLLVAPGYVSEPSVPTAWARQGYAALSLAPRGKLRSNARFNPGYPGLLTHNIVDRNTYAYRGFYVDAARAVDVLLAQPEVDPARIGITGSSQGGALSIVVSALRGEIVATALGAPYLCGIMDAIELTHSYPYQEINDYLRLHPERRESVAQTVAYFDGINFAPAIRCPVLMNIGLRDDVCPPETGYAVYEAFAGPKQLVPYEDCAHDAGSVWHAPIAERFLAEHLQPGRAT